MIRKFDKFNESIRDYLRPKSEEDIIKSLSELDPTELLFLSCEKGYLWGVDMAIENGAKPDYLNNTPLTTACEMGYIEIVRRLLREPSVDPSFPNNVSIHRAKTYEHYDIVKLLLSYESVTDNLDDIDLIEYKMFADYYG